MEVTDDDAVRVFGRSSGRTLGERAQKSSVRFVRTQDHLFVSPDDYRGAAISAYDALDAYGFAILREAVDFGSAILAPSVEEPARTLRDRRIQMGLSDVRELARATGLSTQDIEHAEDKASRTPPEHLNRLATALALDERLLGFAPTAGGDPTLGARLRSVGHRSGSFTPKLVLALAEAAWVISTQVRLMNGLGIWKDTTADFPKSEMYGVSGYPAWRHGFYLAQEARRLLSLGPTGSIKSMRALYDRLGIPLIEMPLPGGVAGATVSTSGRRGVVVNTESDNQNVWVRRATLAHELGHLLWDPEPELHAIRVDDFNWNERAPWDESDRVEARANAFAIEFLAPTAAVFEMYRARPDAGVRGVMVEFGISATAARYHVWNSIDRDENFERLRVNDSSPTIEWEAIEDYTNAYFPIASTPASRRGTFAGVVVAAEEKHLISEESASAYLTCGLEEYRANRGAIKEALGPTESA